jgi:DNA-binding transcriptional regulator YiaG
MKQPKEQATREQVAKRTIERLRKFTEHLESGRLVSESYSCRKIILDVEMQPYTAEMVKEVRGTLKVSQALFAKFLNVSVSAVQKWERGVQQPDGAACRLLDEIRREPDYWRKRFMSMAKMVTSSATR